MIHYRYYADAPDEAIASLVANATLARLVTVAEPGHAPHLGLYPFLRTDAGFELHLHRADEQIADLRARPVCLLEVDEVLSSIPSTWIDPANPSFATAYHRTVAFECTATLVDDARALAEQQNRLLASHQPGAGHQPVSADEPTHRALLDMLVGVRLLITRTKVKMKLGQNRDFATRAEVARRLRERGSEIDKRTADALEWTIAAGWTTDGRTR